MKYSDLKSCLILLVIAGHLMVIESLPIEDQQQVTVALPEYIVDDLPVATQNPQETVPLTLLDVEADGKATLDDTKEYQRSTRGFGFGHFGGLGGKLGGLGLGGLGGWGLGGLHGLGLGGFKPFFFKYFG